MTGLSRRGFLGLAAGVGAGAAVGARLAWGSLVDDQLQASPPAASGSGTTTGPPPDTVPPVDPRRVLVVVQLSGGNDGLNTLVPAGDGRYYDARPTLRVAESDVLRLAGTDRWGLHPQLAALVPLWEAGQLVAVDGVGMAGQTRSHFAAMDAWWSAEPGQPLHDGWIGRWLDRTGDPRNPLRAIALGGPALALVSATSVSTTVLDPKAFTLRTPKGADAATVRDAFLATGAPLVPDESLAEAQRSVPAALEAVDLLARAAAGNADDAASGELTPQAARGGNATSLTDLLQTAAGIIDLDIGTKVIVVAGGGFDTHADQADRHPDLLADVADGIAGFLQTMASRGRADHVLVMTTSEFGRRVHENGSGTDHGNGGVQFLAGPMVRGGQVVGQADLGALDEGDLRSVLDTRSLYANALDWLSGPTGPTDEVLGSRYDRLELLRS